VTVTPKQQNILNDIAAWAKQYPCIKAMHVYGSVARNEAKATSDIDIAFEYVANLVSGGMATCYENVNADWETLADRLKAKFGHQPKQTGLSPYADPYDSKAWAAIRVGREIGRSGKVILTWTAPKPDRS
jgi:polymorphic toxin system nucleotidyltransferase-like protein